MKTAFTTCPFAGELKSGDAAIIHQTDISVTCILIDISGHGSKASKLAQETLDKISFLEDLSPICYINQLHQILQNTIGAAASVFKVTNSGMLTFCGVGNVLCKKISSTNSDFVSKNGTLGQRLPSLLEQTKNLAKDDLVIMTTDGVSVRYNHDLLFYKNESVESICHTIVRDFGKSTDDSGCLVLRF